MMSVKASAPGKVIIAGEYAVLDGAPAICMAVNRRAHVLILQNSAGEFVISAPGLSEEPRRYASIADCADDLPLLAAVWQQLSADSVEPMSIELDSSEFVSAAGSKIGVGSSAAVAVALTAALDHFANGGGGDVRELATAAHQQFQGGSGSGADVACCFAGGVIEYRMVEAPTYEAAWPAGLHYELLWSGQSSDTGAQLEKLAGAKSHHSRAGLVAAAFEMAAVWRDGQLEKIVHTLKDYTTALQHFDAGHQLGIFAAGHAELAGRAKLTDVVYKPCGAGGGDLGIAVSADESALAAFVSAAQAQNFESIDLKIDATGVVVEGSKQ
jgi:phosphomevalonate kinase